MPDLKALSDKISEFEKITNYCFKDKKKLVMALTHSSFANECKDKNWSVMKDSNFWVMQFWK